VECMNAVYAWHTTMARDVEWHNTMMGVGCDMSGTALNGMIQNYINMAPLVYAWHTTTASTPAMVPGTASTVMAARRALSRMAVRAALKTATGTPSR